jgi:hypothetical protein
MNQDSNSHENPKKCEVVVFVFPLRWLAVSPFDRTLHFFASWFAFEFTTRAFWRLPLLKIAGELRGGASKIIEMAEIHFLDCHVNKRASQIQMSLNWKVCFLKLFWGSPQKQWKVEQHVSNVIQLKHRFSGCNLWQRTHAQLISGSIFSPKLTNRLGSVDCESKPKIIFNILTKT